MSVSAGLDRGHPLVLDSDAEVRSDGSHVRQAVLLPIVDEGIAASLRGLLQFFLAWHATEIDCDVGVGQSCDELLLPHRASVLCRMFYDDVILPINILRVVAGQVCDQQAPV